MTTATGTGAMQSDLAITKLCQDIGPYPPVMAPNMFDPARLSLTEDKPGVFAIRYRSHTSPEALNTPATYADGGVDLGLIPLMYRGCASLSRRGMFSPTPPNCLVAADVDDEELSFWNALRDQLTVLLRERLHLSPDAQLTVILPKMTLSARKKIHERWIGVHPTYVRAVETHVSSSDAGAPTGAGASPSGLRIALPEINVPFQFVPIYHVSAISLVPDSAPLYPTPGATAVQQDSVNTVYRVTARPVALHILRTARDALDLVDRGTSRGSGGELSQVPYGCALASSWKLPFLAGNPTGSQRRRVEPPP